MRLPRRLAGPHVLCLLAPLFATGLVATAQAETLPVRLEFAEAGLTVVPRGEFVAVTLPECELLPRVGAPALPYRAEQIILPPGMMAHGVEAVSVASIRIPCGEVRPAQAPVILGRPGQTSVPPAAVTPDPAVYEGSELYPPDLAIFRGSGHLLDLGVAACEVHPVQYDPAAQELILHTEIALTLTLESDPQATAASKRQPAGEMSHIVQELARQGGMHGLDRLPSERSAGRAMPLDSDAYQYVIVTREDMASAYETYAAWKTQKGVPATVVTVEWIETNYPGRDLPEKIRNFIIMEARANWGTSYVLLGGDQPAVPSRISWAFDCEAGIEPDENDLHADLYYSDLDGSWDENQNGIFGEVADQVDLYPDILVGRAPTNDLAQAEAMVNKFLIYERTPPIREMKRPPPDEPYVTRAFFFAEVLWWIPYTDASIGKEMLADQHFDPSYQIERQYESLGNLTPTFVRYTLDSGPHLTNHAGHAWYTVMSCGPGSFDRQMASDLNNGPQYFVLYSIGCWAGAFDYDSIGERFVTNPNGGAIAFVGNSRYGWGSPGNPGWGYSETFDRDFYAAILTEGLTQFGAAVAWPKILRIPYSQDENVYRWHEYQVNLFGDPEISCHTTEIKELALEAPAAIPTGAPEFTATVTDDSGPVAGARLCLAGLDVYQVGFSDQTGQVTFAPGVATAQALTLTATAANHQYAELSIFATGNDPFLTVVSQTVDDDALPPSSGNGDGEIAAGETIELYVTVHNYGGEAAAGVTGTISAASPHVTLIDDEVAYGTVAGGEEATNPTPFVLTIAPDCPPAQTILCNLLLTDNAVGSWSSALPLTVVKPGPRCHHYTFHELGGNGNGLIDPGETVALTLTIVNEGSGGVSPIAATLTTPHPDMTIIQGSAATLSGLAPGESADLMPPFEVRIESGCPAITYCSLDALFTHDEGSDTDSFLLAIGEPGLADDMESGPGEWTHSGTNDLWHLTDHNQHSGSFSWYCGTQDHRYLNQMDASLTSPAFVVPENARFSFWCTFSVTTYGSDGLYIEAYDDGIWEALDYLGSGGALDSTLFGCDWGEHVYPLDGLTPGSTTQVRFRFISDLINTEEGFYIDDVAIHSVSLTSVEFPLGLSPMALSEASPNPVGGPARWHLFLPAPARVTARLYNSRGAMVRDLLSDFLPAGEHLVGWDGRTALGRRAPAGVYFLRLRAGETDAVRKVVRINR